MVVVASKSGARAVCMPPPLGGPKCANTARFKQINVLVGSANSLTVFQKNIKTIEAFLRQGSLRHVVVVSDDDCSSKYGCPAAATFHAWLKARKGWSGYTFDSVVGLTTNSCAFKGTKYVALSNWTKGHKQNVCQASWAALFKHLGKVGAGAVKTTYPLKGKPASAASVKVYYDNKLQAKGTAWGYDATNNRVVLKGTLPKANTTLKICYKK